MEGGAPAPAPTIATATATAAATLDFFASSRQLVLRQACIPARLSHWPRRKGTHHSPV